MKALFFLRHYNDIDHIVPVISEWVHSGHHCDVVIIGKAGFIKDFRIEFLKKLDGVRVIHIRQLLSLMEFMRWRLQMLLLVRSSHHSFMGPLIKLLAEIYDSKRRGLIWHRTARYLFEYGFKEGQQGVIVFDWIERNSAICVEWVEVVVAMARTRGLGTVSLPHGDSPHASQLIRHGEWRLQPDISFSAAGMFDQVVVPNELCSKRFRPFLDARKIAILGSPRYCDEWLARLALLLPPSPLVRSDSRLKIAIFLRKANFTTFWEEVEEMVRMIAAFPGVELMIKPHTRGGWKQSLTKSTVLRRLPNVTMADDGIHSTHLMNWSDVIIDLATSVVFEAVKASKPVLAADYLHAGRSALAEFMPETALHCRDDVYEKIDYFLSHGCDVFYIEAHRQRFLREMLDVGGTDVLPRYVSLLEMQTRKE
ncbi:hypothetical protein SAMN05216419_101838 [Nitrosomonas cryotolerans]|uniref:CDP-Glycerol:Poly(Glycerophosphate) glycerophosphotransferase n=1 Tax=Nitrosomonas cryotolerans ATCC 49181 TaxID=1131553 RepID=A0A1N6FT67_9PROT|nr:hypothetical protein [Nitrosomonas cryotolerans]SFP76961.1 hypothetical protein SAMN05216419_101838 [Nitrosomonas cryotolerans]SIN98443.1 hypothetical protein SAMN02743940_0392 [Nitrosomonas cryotolerans ATCC 49181]